MTYRVIQSIRGNHYLYEVDAVWDPVKKKSKQIRTYLGKCDPDGNIIVPPVKRGPLITKTFGSYYSLLEIADDCGLYGDLISVYGEEDANVLISLAIIRAIRPAPMRQILNTIDESFLPELLKLRKLSLQDFSMILWNLGGSDQSMKKFFRKRASGEIAISYDLSYISPGGYRDSFVYCAECRTAKMPHKNVCISYSEKTELPFYLGMCAGEMTDIGSLERMDEQISEIGMKRIHHVMGPLFYNPLNISDMLRMGMDFTMTIPLDRDVARIALKEASRTFFTDSKTDDYNGYTLKVFENVMTISGIDVRTIVLEEEDRRMDEFNELYNKISAFESYVKGLRWYDNTLQDLSRGTFADIIGLFDLSGSKDGSVNAERRQEEVSDARDRCGKLVILTTSSEPWRSVLALCKKRDVIEGDYTTLRDDVESRAKFIPTEQAAYGLMLVEMMSCTLKDELLRRLRQHEEGRKKWSHDFISEMSKLKITRFGDRWHLNEMTDEQRGLLEMADVRLPFQEY